MKNLFFILFLVVFFQPTKAQDVDSEFIHFYSYNLDYRITKEVNIKAGELFSFDSKSYALKYTQFKLGGSYRFSERMSTEFLYKPMLFKGTTKDIWYSRISGALTHRSKLFSLPLKNTITTEWFSPKLKKYQFRFIYTIKLSFKNKFLPLRATPYIKGQLYYYLNGKPINYWDENGEILLARNSPNGFHRYRFGAGVRFRPAKHFYVSVYYIWQEEFNTNFTKNRQLNILNKRQTAIKYPFNNYQVLGISFSYSITPKNKK